MDPEERQALQVEQENREKLMKVCRWCHILVCLLLTVLTGVLLHLIGAGGVFVGFTCVLAFGAYVWLERRFLRKHVNRAVKRFFDSRRHVH
ncbi:hypothetical protein [Ruminococcus champanellensis]|uniref:hypothetical protein n=1 Tax=Ruminococcus champanellensis TaxID=1161942 RepID=UPI0026DD5B1A|nr:hypothetical protein [Ruminococcus champanellensis]